MKKLIEDNYKSIVKRGLITPDTRTWEFVDKLIEEVNELAESLDVNQYGVTPPLWDEFTDKSKKESSFEVADIILVCLNFAKHYDIDIEKILKEKIQINFKR